MRSCESVRRCLFGYEDVIRLWLPCTSKPTNRRVDVSLVRLSARGALASPTSRKCHAPSIHAHAAPRTLILYPSPNQTSLQKRQRLRQSDGS